jgi:phosphopantothenoylcysteine synthetase/decarboxylase
MDTGFDADFNEVTIFFKDGSPRHFERAPKLEIARQIIKICISIAENH